MVFALIWCEDARQKWELGNLLEDGHSGLENTGQLCNA